MPSPDPQAHGTDAKVVFEWVRTGRTAVLRRRGDQGTIVVVPGAMVDARSWLPFGRALHTPMSVAIVNRRGRHPSDDLPADATVSDEVEDLNDTLNQLQPPFVLVGWSYGGLLAAEAAINRADVGSMILYEPVSHPFVSSSVEPLQSLIASGDYDGAVEHIMANIGRASATEIATMRQSPSWDQYQQLVRSATIELSALNRHQARLAEVDVPTSIIIGEFNEDREPYGASSQVFLNGIACSKKVILPRNGHLAHTHDPTLLAKTVGAIISNIEVQGGL